MVELRYDLNVKLEAGDVIAFSNWGFWGTIVRIVTRADDGIGHLGIMVNSEEMVESANKGVVKVRIAEKIKTTKGKLIACKLSPYYRDIFNQNKGNFEIAVRENLGKKYDPKQAFLLGLDHLIFVLGIPKNNNRLFCSELIIVLLQTAGILSKDLIPAQFSPQRVYDLFIFWDKVLFKK